MSGAGNSRSFCIAKLAQAVWRQRLMADRPGARAALGFSLVELMVVVVILGIALAVSAPRLDKALERSRFDASVRLILAAARGAQVRSVTRQTESVIAFDVNARRFRVDSNEAQAIDPASTVVTVTVAETEQHTGWAGIRFFPDGSATGGRIDLTLDGQQTVIDIDWLTGVASVVE